MGCSALIGAALGLTGAGVQELANAKTQGQMNDVMNEQQAEQRSLQAKGQSVFQTSLGQSTPGVAAQQIQQGADQYKTAAQNAQAVPLGVASPAITTQDQSANAARAALGNTAMSNYAGYGQYGVDQRLKDQVANSQLGVIGQQSQYANSMLPSELQAAQNDFNGLRGAGSMLGTIGSLVGLAGSAGLFGGGASTAVQHVGASNWANPVGQLGSSNLGFGTASGLNRMFGLSNSAINLGSSPLGSPLWLGQVAPQPQYGGIF